MRRIEIKGSAMSETILKVLIDELKVIRLVCKKCAAALEMPLGKLDGNGNIQSLACPACGTGYRLSKDYRSDALAKLADAVQELAKSSDCQIEFVLPGDGE